MQYVNDTGMSSAMFNAIVETQRAYTRSGELSTTSCLEPPRMATLRRRHDERIIKPVSQLIPSFIGTCCHNGIAQHKSDAWTVEEEMVAKIGDITFSGRPDIYYHEERLLSDYKFLSIWSWLIDRKVKDEYVAQGNINAMLLETNGLKVDRIMVEMVFLDWKFGESKRDKSYPTRVTRVEIERWDPEHTINFVKERIKMHKEAALLNDESLPGCSPAEQWSKPTRWAVMKPGGKRAVKVCDTEAEAVAVKKNVPKGTIVKRPGERVRCMDFCEVAPFCNQHAEQTLEETGHGPEDEA